MRRSVIQVLGAALLIVLLAAAGFAVGRSSRTSQSAAAHAARVAEASAYGKARASAYATAWRGAYGKGQTDGKSAAKHDGSKAGTSAGQAVNQRTATASGNTGTSSSSACVDVGGICEVRASPDHSCPAGSVPNADGGVVCVPQSVIQQANPPPNTATTPNVNTPEGQQLLKTSPDCANTPPPPPGYTGPVQC